VGCDAWVLRMFDALPCLHGPPGQPLNSNADRGAATLSAWMLAPHELLKVVVVVVHFGALRLLAVQARERAEPWERPFEEGRRRAGRRS
jgi:hypothetical protein